MDFHVPGAGSLCLRRELSPSGYSDLPVGHHSVRQAGQAAREIGARRLLLTHLYPEIPLESLRREAADSYDGELLLAQPGMVVEL